MNNTHEFENEIALISDTTVPYALAALYQEPFQYQKNYAEITGSIPAGWFLSWFGDICPPYEEMVLSNDDICHTLCFTNAQWTKVRSLLIKQEILKYRTEKKQTFFSLNDDKVEWLLRHRPRDEKEDIINTLFPFILGVNRLHCAALTALGVSLNAVILLAWLIDTLPAKPLNEREPVSTPILIEYKNITADTFLSKRQIANALTELSKINIVNTQENQDDKEKYSTIYFNVLGNIAEKYIENIPTGGNHDEYAP